MGRVYYNEFNKQKAAWLRHLIEEGAVAHGVVDERSIHEVQAEDLRGFAQCHFFAGIGVWSYCLRRAGWPDDRPVWTGSCPCGPFSKAGLRQGFADPRHLWPEWFRLIGECRPVVLFGEQSDEALAWLDLVSSNLESRGYAVGSAVLPAAGFGGAHERHRLGFVADADNAEWWSDRAPWHDGFWPKAGRVQGYGHIGDGGAGDEPRRMADADADGQSRGQEPDIGSVEPGEPTPRWGDAGRRGAPSGPGLSGLAGLSDTELGIVRRAWRGEEGRATLKPGDPPWAGPDWLLCRDSRWRPIEPGLSPLVDETPARMVRLRGYGDAIDAEAFTNLIGTYMDAAPSLRAAA